MTDILDDDTAKLKAKLAEFKAELAERNAILAKEEAKLAKDRAELRAEVGIEKVESWKKKREHRRMEVERAVEEVMRKTFPNLDEMRKSGEFAFDKVSLQDIVVQVMEQLPDLSPGRTNDRHDVEEAIFDAAPYNDEKSPKQHDALHRKHMDELVAKLEEERRLRRKAAEDYKVAKELREAPKAQLAETEKASAGNGLRRS